VAFIKICRGFGLNVLAFDVCPQSKLAVDLGFTYCALEDIYTHSDIISLHLPLKKETRYLIDAASISKMKQGVMLINTSRGGLIDTKALICALKSKKIGSAGLDVYEEEDKYFFQDHSQEALTDDVLVRLMTFPNVLLTSHQGFLTSDALLNIAHTTLQNVCEFETNSPLTNCIS
jgi:D-lactate dehydrogenase